MNAKKLTIALIASISASTAISCAVKSGFEAEHGYYDYAYTDSGQSVIDLNTGLMWQRCAVGQSYQSSTESCIGAATAYSTWYDALNSVTTINTTTPDGYGDWRIPNAKELVSILETGCTSPAINATAFPNAPASNFYSNTPTRSTNSDGNAISAGEGVVIPFFFGNGSNIKNLRLVRTFN